MHTFAVLQLNDGTEPEVIAHVKTTEQAITICNAMQSKNPEYKFVWIMLPRAK
jgi:hypothetical protein